MPQHAEKSGFLDRTKYNIISAWHSLSGTARAITGSIDPNLPKSDQERLIKQMQDCLNPKGGELTARRNTVSLGGTYLGLSEQGKKHFFALLAKEFDIDRQKLSDTMQEVAKADDAEKRVKAEKKLRDALVSPRMKILRQFNALPEGIKFLVDMRSDVLRISGKNHPELLPLSDDLHNLLSAWFDVGLLDMQEITWDSSAALLEKLIAYEAVHEIRSWNDLKNRLDSDRRCFAFFHPKMPNEPLIFVEVALVKGMADSIQVLLDESLPAVNPDDADTAIFYSISNAQAGLAGISFGNFLIKRVVDRLSREFPKINTYATLSPIPGFAKWLDEKLTAGEKDFLTPSETKALKKLGVDNLQPVLQGSWLKNENEKEVLEPMLKRLCAHYLLKEKRGDLALDPVANFHLTNGARVERLNWLGDVSAKGAKQSYTMMVNYLYQLSKIDDNHERYLSAKSVAASSQVKGLL